MSLLNAYKLYYRQQDLHSVNVLLQAIFEYDFLDYQYFRENVAELRKSVTIHTGDTKTYYTTGSTSLQSRRYEVGPFTNFWNIHLERANKLIDRNVTLQLHPWFPIINRPSGFMVMPAGKHPFRYSCVFNHCCDVFVLANYLSKILHPICVTAYPDQLLSLANRMDFVVLAREKISIINTTGWEAFYKKQSLIENGVHINDNMINWVTMMNFNTCKAGYMHFLPVFVVQHNLIVNLINLVGDGVYPVDDLMVIEDKVINCSCGKNRLSFKFIPHLQTALRSPEGRWVYDLSLAEKLLAVYFNLQFIQKKEKVLVLFSTFDERYKQDQQVITSFFNEYKLNVLFLRDRYLQINDKRPTFFNNIHRWPLERVEMCRQL